MRVVDYVAEFLYSNGIKDIFMLSGGGVMFLNDGLACHKGLTKICCHHEQAVAMAAVSYAKYKDNVGCGYLTTGCGGTNAITGVLHAWQDSTPVIFISGQVKRKETTANIDIPLRQFGVQEADIVTLVKPITKYAFMVNEPNDIAYHLEKALHIATTGRKGPVWIDIPMDVQSAEIDINKLKHFNASELNDTVNKPSGSDMKFIEDAIKKSKRPVIIAGQGVRLSDSIGLFEKLVKQYNIPFVTSRMGFDILPTEEKLYIGRIGNKGTRAGNFAVQNADLLLVLGSRLSVSSTGHQYEYFGREAKIIVVDIDKNEHKKNTVKIDKEINSNVKDFLELLNLDNGLSFKDWADICYDWKERYPLCLKEYYESKDGINLYLFTEHLSRHLKDNSAVITDAGSAVYVPAQGLRTTSKNQRYITSGGQAEMGFSLPGCIGVAVASGKDNVIGITGDGSFQLNIQELQTVVHYNLPIKLFVWNNNGYLSIRATQRKFFNGRLLGTDKDSGVSFPEVSKIADAYGIKFFKMDSIKDIDNVFDKVINYNGPVLCEVISIPDQEIIPAVSSKKLPDGRMVSSPIEDMYPFLDRDEFKKNMIVKPIDE